MQTFIGFGAGFEMHGWLKISDADTECWLPLVIIVSKKGAEHGKSRWNNQQ